MKDAKLDEVLYEKLDLLKSMDPKSEEYRATLETVDKLYSHKFENAKSENEKQTLWAKCGVEIAIAAATIGFNAIWMRRGFNYEKTGVFASTTFKQLWSKFRIGR